MEKRKLTSSDAGPIHVVTGIVEEKRLFKWTIKEFDTIRKSEQLIKEQRFEFEAGQRSGKPLSWECFLGCNKTETTNKKFAGVYIRASKNIADGNELNASYNFKICRADGSIFFCKGIPFKNMMDPALQNKGWGFLSVIDLEAESENLPLIDGALNIEIEFVLHATAPACKRLKLDVSTELKMFETKSLEKLSQDLEQIDILAGEGANAVTKIVSMDEVEFPVNRGILAARSDVFRAMFQTKMRETHTGQVYLDDLSGKTLKVLLHYVHTGRLTEDWKCDDVIYELVMAAHRYEFKILTEFLDSVVGRVSGGKNVKKMALLVQRLGMERAQKDLLQLIKDNAGNLEDIILFDTNS